MTRVSDNPTEKHKKIVDLSGYGFVGSNSAWRYKLGALYSEREESCYSVKVRALGTVNIFTTEHKLHSPTTHFQIH
jgi:hypothetical protein